MLDTSGSETYAALRDQWIRSAEGFVLVYSITSRTSFSHIQATYDRIQRVKQSNNAESSSPLGRNYLDPHLSIIPPPTRPVTSLLLVGNKSDQAIGRTVSMQEGMALAQKLGCRFVEASAKNGANVEPAFHAVVRSLREQTHEQSSQPPIQTREQRRGNKCVILRCWTRCCQRLFNATRILSRHDRASET